MKERIKKLANRVMSEEKPRTRNKKLSKKTNKSSKERRSMSLKKISVRKGRMFCQQKKVFLLLEAFLLSLRIKKLKLKSQLRNKSLKTLKRVIILTLWLKKRKNLNKINNKIKRKKLKKLFEKNMTLLQQM